MNFSKRNPLLRNKMDQFNEVIGSLGEEIQEQNLGDIDGGTSLPCLSVNATIVATASSMGCVETASIISAGTAWVNDKVTAYYKCGGVATVTLECLC
ncbi:plantaricin C family lantibiotic [Hathewaya massiliensis]|uniref:plantaricin C family lantibiotic n=1 Tax=Hathewaya massiliensis TaxID=1964382 RepID=UPI001157599E|nr:plantaricin C family lantibiotic [Hathewaya massiliensis]